MFYTKQSIEAVVGDKENKCNGILYYFW